MATKRNITQDTVLMVIAIIILSVTSTCLIGLSFFWSLGETKRYVYWLMPNDYSLALAWFVQFGADAFRIVARVQTNKRLVRFLHFMAIVFNVADGATNHGALRATPLAALEGYDQGTALVVEAVIAYGTALAEELTVLFLATLFRYWGYVSIDCGLPGWMRPIWLVGKMPQVQRPQSVPATANNQPRRGQQSPAQYGQRR